MSSLCSVFISPCVLIVFCVHISICTHCVLCSHLPVSSLCSDSVHNFLRTDSVLTLFTSPYVIVFCVHISRCPHSVLTVLTSMYSLFSEGVHISVCPHNVLCSQLCIHYALTMFTSPFFICPHCALTVFRLLPVYSLCFNSVQSSPCALIVL